MAVPQAKPGLGELLRYWRRVRGKSQLELASAAMTTPRYVSFVETGRSSPSRQMVVRLARALDVPLRERNGLLLAAGYAPLYAAGSLDAPEFEPVRAALASMLDQHEPFPAVVMDRGWNVLQANKGAVRLFGRLHAPEPLPDPTNILDVMIEPGPVRKAVLNWAAVVPALLERSRREAVAGVLDLETAKRVERLSSVPGVAEVLSDASTTAAMVPVLDIHLSFESLELRFFSVVSSLGTPIDVTAQELRVETFFPSDQATRRAWVAETD
jgi:transcriptional regulator with XRE-family HTH domain